jgi:hypothetical protein
MAGILAGLIIWVPSVLISTGIGCAINKAGTGFVLGLVLGPFGIAVMAFMLWCDRNPATEEERMTTAEREYRRNMELNRRRQGPEYKASAKIRQIMVDVLNEGKEEK